MNARTAQLTCVGNDPTQNPRVRLDRTGCLPELSPELYDVVTGTCP